MLAAPGGTVQEAAVAIALLRGEGGRNTEEEDGLADGVRAGHDRYTGCQAGHRQPHYRYGTAVHRQGLGPWAPMRHSIRYWVSWRARGWSGCSVVIRAA